MRSIRMVALEAPAAILVWLGRRGTGAVAALVVIGIGMPWIGAVLKPYVSQAVFVLLCISFFRMDAGGFRTHLKHPYIVLAATAWTSLVIPILFVLGCFVFGLKDRSPDLYLALMLQGVASPMMASPALAALMGLDATLVLMTLVTSTALIPITAPLFAQLFIGPSLTLSPLELGTQLFAILAGSALVGFALRRIVGLGAIGRQRERIDGFNILVLFVFVAAIMESVPGRFQEAPLATVGLAALAFAVFFVVLLLTIILFSFAGRERALVFGFMASQRNMGLMLAATGGSLPDLTWLYFALSQFPIYLSPRMLQPLARRLLTRAIGSSQLHSDSR